MKPLRPVVLAVIVLAAGTAAALVTHLGLRSGADPVRVPWTGAAASVAAAAFVLAATWAVRQFKAGKRPGLDPLRAARAVMLAQAGAYTGALLSGAYGGLVVVLLRDWSHGPRREAATAAGLAALGALVLLAAGVIGERWCRVKAGDDADKGAPGAAQGGTLAA